MNKRTDLWHAVLRAYRGLCVAAANRLLNRVPDVQWRMGSFGIALGGHQFGKL